MSGLIARRGMMQGKDNLPGSPTPVGVVGIACWISGQRRYFTDADWDVQYKPNALGVYVNTENTHCIIYPTKLGGEWSNSVLCPNVTTTSSQEEAKADYNGAYNTQCVWNAYNDGIIDNIAFFENVASVQTLDGSIPYVPAMGELWDIFQNHESVITYFDEIGFSFPTNSNCYSSTQFNEKGAWTAYQKDQIRSLVKTGGYGGIAVTSI